MYGTARTALNENCFSKTASINFKNCDIIGEAGVNRHEKREISHKI